MFVLIKMDPDALRVATRLARAQLAGLQPNHALLETVAGGDDRWLGLLAANCYLQALRRVIEAEQESQQSE